MVIPVINWFSCFYSDGLFCERNRFIYYWFLLSLIFALNDPAFPATHHTTLVAGYAIAQTGNILIAIAFGVIAHFVGLLFGMVFNTDCGTHVDPPAVAIAICSLILFTLF